MSENAIKTIKMDHGEIEIHHDTNPINPREGWDNLGTIVGNRSSNRYFCSSYHIANDKNERTPEDIQQLLLGIGGIAFKLDRSYDGAISINPHSNPDGYIYCRRETAIKNGLVHSSGRHIGKVDWKRVKECLENEVKIYSHYCTGDVFGYVSYVTNPTTNEREEVDSVWGFFDLLECIEYAKHEYPKLDNNWEFDMSQAT